ncbi:MAG: class I SAM-dependent methyltransferase family protein [Methanobacteriaceae archaeon]|jgi:tRNA wybutosine-synthesizing protein 2|nr:class I SAM-dependent methyltransferase family protein [Methanobacteriaceae archaeon]MDO9627913.1 class I SAM-dependent methyltransferase family protein [Methanobacteriaceae archaeon]
MKWKKIGHVLLVDKDIENPKKLLEMKGIETVVKLGNIGGKKREPDVKILAGSNTETIHRENGCIFKLDVARVMWSKGNTNERMRIANIIGEGERVLDMFAGIGYFTIPAAVHSKAEIIHSIEINPVSYGYLNENMSLNKVENIVKPVLGDSMDIAPQFSVDRVLMGYIGNTQDYLKSAIAALDESGIIHYHESVYEKIKFERPEERIRKSAGGMDVEILNKRVIKKYSPGVVHVVIDAKITK